MNPIKWVRWKVVIVLGAIVGALYFLGLNPLVRHEINSLGSSGQAGARFQVEKVALGLLQGETRFDAFKLATPRQTSPQDEGKERVASADEIICDLGMDDALRKRFAMDEVGVKKPLLRIQRRADGTINVGDIGAKEPEKPEGKPTDWVKAAEEWAQRIKKRMEERRKKEEEERKKDAEPPKQKGMKADYDLQVTYPYRDLPKALIRKLSAEAVEIQFEDETGAVKPPPIKNGKIEILNLSDKPEVLKNADGKPLPISLRLSGEIENAPIEITGTIDLTKAAGAAAANNLFSFDVKAKGVPLQQVVQAFAAGSLDATFEQGTADPDAHIQLTDLEKISIRPAAAGASLFSLHGVKMQAKPGSKIAGFEGAQFATAVNEVGDLEIKDLEIGGTLTSPEFKWGDTVKELVVSGGKAFAKKQAGKAVEKASEEAQKLIDRQLKDQSPEVKKGLEKILPGGDVKKAAGGLLDGTGLFGTKKKTEGAAPAPEPK